MLLRAIRLTVGKQWLRTPAEKILASQPRLRRLLRSLALAGSLAETAQPGPAAPEALSPRASHVYAELKRAIAERRG